ncbi:MAG: hypothetical protein K0Q87_1121 [Neobacillus sp.]|jgi:hypothetical protein|nr:hypothetical protein [Neobacillus sp.]
MAEIKVRGLSDEVVTLLNRLAKKTNRPREEFLRQELTRIAYTNANEENKRIYDLMFNRLMIALVQNTKAIVSLVQAGVIPNAFLNEEGEIEIMRGEDEL